MIEKEGIFYVTCLICNLIMKRITNSHLKHHKLTPKEYEEKFPSAQISSIISKNRYKLYRIGKKLSEETKHKISLKHKGKIIPKEMRLRISQKQKGKKKSPEGLKKLIEYYKTHDSPMKGKKHSFETKKLLSELGKGRSPPNKGKPVLEEIKKKISDKLKGRSLTPETREKMKIARRNISLETRLKISKALTGKPKKRRNLEKTVAKPNKFEKECIDLFNTNNLPLKFVGDYVEGFFIEGKIPDFVATNNKKLLVEVFCDYYKIKQYGSVDNYKYKRDSLFSKYGWKTLFFSDKDIKFKTNECINKIKKELV